MYTYIHIDIYIYIFNPREYTFSARNPYLAATKLQEHVTPEVRRRCPLDQKITVVESPVAQTKLDFTKNGDLPIENGDLPIENGDLPIENGD